MNKTQFDIIADRLIKSHAQRDAVRAVFFNNMSCYAAEHNYQRPAATVSRDVKRVTELYEFCLKVNQSPALK